MTPDHDRRTVQHRERTAAMHELAQKVRERFKAIQLGQRRRVLWAQVAEDAGVTKHELTNLVSGSGATDETRAKMTTWLEKTYD